MYLVDVMLCNMQTTQLLYMKLSQILQPAADSHRPTNPSIHQSTGVLSLPIPTFDSNCKTFGSLTKFSPTTASTLHETIPLLRPTPMSVGVGGMSLDYIINTGIPQFI